MKTLVRSLLASLLAVSLVTPAALAADLVAVNGISHKHVGRDYLTTINLTTKVGGEMLFRGNNRAVASPSRVNVTRGQRVTIVVTSPQANNILTVTHTPTRSNQAIAW